MTKTKPKYWYTLRYFGEKQDYYGAKLWECPIVLHKDNLKDLLDYPKKFGMVWRKDKNTTFGGYFYFGKTGARFYITVTKAKNSSIKSR